MDIRYINMIMIMKNILKISWNGNKMKYEFESKFEKISKILME